MEGSGRMPLERFVVKGRNRLQRGGSSYTLAEPGVADIWPFPGEPVPVRLGGAG